MHHHIAAGTKAEGGEVEPGRETTVARRAAPGYGDLALAEGDVLAFADGQRDAEACGGDDAVVVGDGEDRTPAALPRLNEREALGGRQDLHLRRCVGDGVDAVQRRSPCMPLVLAMRRIDAVKEGSVERPAGDPVAAGTGQGQRRTAEHDHDRNARLGIEAQHPFQTGPLRRTSVEVRLVPHRQAGVGWRIDAQVPGDQTRHAGRHRPLGAGRQGGRSDVRPRPEGHCRYDEQGGSPEEQDGPPRPIARERVGRACAEPIEQPRPLQPLQATEVPGIGKQQSGAVLHVRPGAVEPMRQPGPIEAGCATQRREV